MRIAFYHSQSSRRLPRCRRRLLRRGLRHRYRVPVRRRRGARLLRRPDRQRRQPAADDRHHPGQALRHRVRGRRARRGLGRGGRPRGLAGPVPGGAAGVVHDVVSDHGDVWAEVTVASTTLPRQRLGATAFAVAARDAQRADSADFAETIADGSVTDAKLAPALAASIAALDARLDAIDGVLANGVLSLPSQPFASWTATISAADDEFRPFHAPAPSWSTGPASSRRTASSPYAPASTWSSRCGSSEVGDHCRADVHVEKNDVLLAFSRTYQSIGGGISRQPLRHDCHGRAARHRRPHPLRRPELLRRSPRRPVPGGVPPLTSREAPCASPSPSPIASSPAWSIGGACFAAGTVLATEFPSEARPCTTPACSPTAPANCYGRARSPGRAVRRRDRRRLGGRYPRGGPRREPGPFPRGTPRRVPTPCATTARRAARVGRAPPSARSSALCRGRARCAQRQTAGGVTCSRRRWRGRHEQARTSLARHDHRAAGPGR